MSNYAKPLPEITEITKPLWEASKRGELVIQKCRKCGHMQWYPRPSCVNCASRELEWTKVSGRGKVYSFTVVRQVIGNSPEFQKDIPFVVAEIDLEEGVRLYSNIIGIAHEEVEVDMPVEVVFEECTTDISLPKFKPAKT